VSPGPERLLPNSSESDQLFVLARPFTPGNGFLVQQAREAVLRRRSSSSSPSSSSVDRRRRSAFSKTGAISYLAGRDSLWPGLHRARRTLYSSSSTSAMQASTRSGWPKY
jgi:hypothetical protein